MVKKAPGCGGSNTEIGDNEENASQSVRKLKKDMTVEERNLARAQK